MIFLIINIPIIFYLLGRLFSINLKEYQGFTTRFFSDKDTEISINSIIFWTFLIPIYSIFMYLFRVLIITDNEFSYIWLISPIFWVVLLIWIILLNRINLVNKTFIFLIGFTSSILNYYISNVLFTGNLSDLEPNKSNVSWQLYSIVFLFLASLIQIIYNNDNYLLKRKNYIKSKILLYKTRYKLISNLEDSVKCLILAILIKEDFERPPIIRAVEILFNRKTRHIAQNDAQNDWHSVYLLTRDVVTQVNQSKGVELEKIMGEILYKINNSQRFKEDVENLYWNVKEIICKNEI